MTPMKAIRAKCLDCCCDSALEVKLCVSQKCPLWVYRMGHNPTRAGVGGRGFDKKKPFSRSDSDEQEEKYDDDE